MVMADIPLATMEELQTAEIGLYRVKTGDGPTLQRRRMRDIFTGIELIESPAILLARVRENDGVVSPSMVESFEIRSDGKQIVTQWAKQRG